MRLDIEMPVMDGYQTLAALKATPHTCDVPVEFLSGRAGSHDVVVEALRLGGCAGCSPARDGTATR